MRIAGCILAGGKSSRMGADKANALLGNKRLLDHAIERLRPQVSQLAVNTNDVAMVGHYPKIADEQPGFIGPLAGILAGLNWAASLNPKADALVTIAVDAPFFPLDLVDQLQRFGSNKATVARSAGQLHPVFALWPLETAETLRNWLNDESHRRVKDFLASIPHEIVDFTTPDGFDPFTNINTPEDLAAAELHLQKS